MFLSRWCCPGLSPLGNVIFVTGGNSYKSSINWSSQLAAFKKLMSSKIFELRPFLYFEEIKKKDLIQSGT